MIFSPNVGWADPTLGTIFQTHPQPGDGWYTCCACGTSFRVLYGELVGLLLPNREMALEN